MLKPGDIAIVSGARTPFGRYCGKLKDFTAQELAAVADKGGMEAMSQAPFVIRGRDGFTLAPGGKLEDSLMVALLDTYCGSYMANTAELYGSEHGITRQMQDEFALRSQQKADAAYKEGRLQEELVPVPLRNHKGEPTGESLTEDDHRRPQTTLEGLAKL